MLAQIVPNPTGEVLVRFELIGRSGQTRGGGDRIRGAMLSSLLLVFRTSQPQTFVTPQDVTEGAENRGVVVVDREAFAAALLLTCEFSVLVCAS